LQQVKHAERLQEEETAKKVKEARRKDVLDGEQAKLRGRMTMERKRREENVDIVNVLLVQFILLSLIKYCLLAMSGLSSFYFLFFFLLEFFFYFSVH